MAYLPSAIFAEEGSADCESFTDHLSAQHLSAILTAGETISVEIDASSFTLAPLCVVPRIADIVANSTHNVLVEGLFLIPLSAGWMSKITSLDLYNISRSVSSLEGLEYYAHSIDKYQPMYVESYVIDSPVTKNRLPDPLVEVIPDIDIQYMRQRDLSFGKNTYRARYEYGDSVTSVLVTNMDALWYFIFPILAQEKLHIVFSILPQENGVLFHLVTFAEAKNLFGSEKQMATSFTHRMHAVAGWFEARLKERLQ